jgi:hypothetical protein
VRVALFARRKLAEQREGGSELSARLGMSGSADAAQAGVAPILDRPIDQASLREMVRQDFRSRINSLRELLFKDLTDTRVQLLALGA